MLRTIASKTRVLLPALVVAAVSTATSGQGAEPTPPPDTRVPTTRSVQAADFEVVAPGQDAGPGQRFEARWTGLSERASISLVLYQGSSDRVLRTLNYGWREPGNGLLRWNGRGAGGGLWNPGQYGWALRLTDEAGNTRMTNRRSVRLAHAVCGDAGRIVRYRVYVERGLPTTRNLAAGTLARILCEERGWIASDRVRFVYDPQGSLLLGIRSPDETEKRCMQLIGLSVRRYYSCAGSSEVVFNSDRWFGGSDYLDISVPRYRHMLVYHEVGHTLGQRHRTCPGPGPAPVMMQQSKGTGACRPNEYPTKTELRSL